MKTLLILSAIAVTLSSCCSTSVESVTIKPTYSFDNSESSESGSSTGSSNETTGEGTGKKASNNSRTEKNALGEKGTIGGEIVITFRERQNPEVCYAAKALNSQIAALNKAWKDGRISTADYYKQVASVNQNLLELAKLGSIVRGRIDTSKPSIPGAITPAAAPRMPTDREKGAAAAGRMFENAARIDAAIN